MLLLLLWLLPPRWLLRLLLLRSLAPAPALAITPAFAPALALTPAVAFALYCAPLLLLLCSQGIWSLETLPPNPEQVLKGRADFGWIRPNVCFIIRGVFNN